MASNAFPWLTPLAKSLTEIYSHNLKSGSSQVEIFFSEVCQEIQDLVGFDYVAIQLINPEENFIETVYGTGISSEWSGRVKHYLEPDPDLRDIQADIALTGNIEILSGWDNRFDRGIYNDHHHARLVRVLTPIILVQNKNENIKDNWFKWKVEYKDRSHENQRILIRPQLQISEDHIKIIGTLEAGYEDLKAEIFPEEALSLYKLAAEKAPGIYEISSPHGLLTSLVEEARQALGADSGSLHFLFDHQQGRYKYEVASTEIGRKLLKARVPSENGLGWQAIREKRAKFVPNAADKGYKDVIEYNPEAAKEGIEAIAVFPLFINHHQSSLEIQSAVGALYIHFTTSHHFTRAEIDKGQLFASLLAHVLRDYMTQKQIQKQARQQRILHSVAQALAAHIPEDGDLLKDIAWKTLNVVAADVVTIYEYVETERRFLTPPAIAGHLKIENRMHAKIQPGDIPFRLVKRNQDVYAPLVSKETFFESIPDTSDKEPFSRREKIKSVGGILLKVGHEIVGTLFINYRHPHHFSDDEKQIIDILAASAAIAIKNQRWMSVLSELDREIITTLDQKKLGSFG